MKPQPVNIYLVDDNRSFLEAIGAKLKLQLNCNISKFISAEQCLKKLESANKPDLILTDYYLNSGEDQKINADEFLEKVNAKKLNVPVMVYSSKSGIEPEARSIAKGAVEFIQKDNNALRNIPAKVNRMLKILRKEYEQKVENMQKSVVIGIVLFFVLAFSLLQIFTPEYLPNFTIGSLMLGIIIVFFGQSIMNRYNGTMKH